LKQLVQEHKSTGLVIFYEKIRTNGKGTIRIDKDLCDQIYDLGDNCLITQLKYLPRKNGLFSLTSGALGVIWTALGTVSPGNNLKVKATRQGRDTPIQMPLRLILARSWGSQSR